MKRQFVERTVVLGPPLAWLLFLFVAPLFLVFVYSLLTRGPYGGVEWTLTAENYLRALDPLYAAAFLRSVRVAGLTTLICLLLGFPLAYWIARRPPERRTLFLVLVMLPFWTDFLVRTYAWMFILRTEGLINSLLLAAGILDRPLEMLFTEGAVLVGSVYAYLPFMVLPLFASLEKIDPNLRMAATDLGSTPWRTFLHVTLPLAKSGIWAGSVLVCIPVFGTFIIPDLLGGSKTALIGNIIKEQFLAARDWPFGSALAFVVMACVMVVLWVYLRLGHQDSAASRGTA